MRTACLIALAIWVPLGVGCHIESPCDEGLVLDAVTYSCIAMPAATDAGVPSNSDAAADASHDASSGAGATDAAGLDAGPTCSDPGYGDPCSQAGYGSAECTCQADFCALIPGDTEGFCTHAHCTTESACPMGYGCMDISAFDPELESLCVPE